MIRTDEDIGYRRHVRFEDLHVRLFWIQNRQIGLWWDVKGLVSRFWRLYRNEDDGAFLELDGGDYPLQKGRIYLVPAGVRFGCRAVHDVEHFYIHFDVPTIPRLAREELFAAPILLPPSAALEAEVEWLVRWLNSGARAGVVFECRARGVVFAALGLYLESLPAERLERSWALAAAQEPVLPALRYVDQHLAEPLGNAILARLCHLSEDYFIRRFRECMGQTPSHYVLERRITHATHRLLFSEDTIDRIARDAGFANRHHFSRVFAREVGEPPATFRKRRRV